MKRLSTILILLLLQGCGVYECIDTNVVRESKPIEQQFIVKLQFEGKTMSMPIKCEEYYDSMCAERGNYWAIREIGKKSQYQTSSFHFRSNSLGQVEVPIPRCSDMARGKKTPLDHIVLRIEGEPFWLSSSNGSKRTYKSRKTPSGEQKTVAIDLMLSVNGEAIE